MSLAQPAWTTEWPIAGGIINPAIHVSEPSTTNGITVQLTWDELDDSTLVHIKEGNDELDITIAQMLSLRDQLIEFTHIYEHSR
ncbi:hypothetical protein [Glutamicibacter ardleyensis]|uniref:Uncharacterized protein n=1 Tax=Glutamicibacter ardleyensis TaxID=225894 RepID=A0ABQ2DF35_9MICC|nr:hypothetical protein [Glutamicibacter ardleyensis]GGJ55792.1 hypothetical protein GCM10007173_13280 [Glutamicibacter ardleyensis]